LCRRRQRFGDRLKQKTLHGQQIKKLEFFECGVGRRARPSPHNGFGKSTEDEADLPRKR
jgi:hypothetical protein